MAITGRFKSETLSRIGSLAVLAGLCWLNAPRVLADSALVAVAANFAETMRQLQSEFERDSGHRLILVIGSTGKLFAQIVNGAPFDVLLAADQDRPRRLVTDGLADARSRFTYASGRLSLWSADSKRITGDGEAALRSGSFRLAIANPELAPYGVAARETLIALGLFDQLRDRIVMGENIGQTHALVATGNAGLGFVALSYLLSPGNPIKGSRWEVPDHLYSPIRQDAVLLKRAAGNPAAGDLLAFLKGPRARAAITRFGYGVQ